MISLDLLIFVLSFEGYKANWSPEIFKITKVQNTRPTTYLLEDSEGEGIIGGFYGEELNLVNRN